MQTSRISVLLMPAVRIRVSMTSLMLLAAAFWSVASPAGEPAYPIRVSSSSPYVIWRFRVEPVARIAPVSRRARQPATVVVPRSMATPYSGETLSAGAMASTVGGDRTVESVAACEVSAASSAWYCSSVMRGRGRSIPQTGSTERQMAGRRMVPSPPGNARPQAQSRRVPPAA